MHTKECWLTKDNNIVKTKVKYEILKCVKYNLKDINK